MEREYTMELESMAIAGYDKLVILPLEQDDTGSHDHHFFELVYVTDGSAMHTLDGVSGRLTAGDYFIVDYGSRHSYSSSEGFKLINCLFLPEVIDDTLKDCRSFDALVRGCLIRYNKLYLGQSSANRILHDQDGSILALLLGMRKEYEEKRTGYTEIFRCRLREIMILTMRRIARQNTEGMPPSTVVLEAIRYLDTHYREQNVLGRFCEEQHYSRQYISRRFRQETGLTAREYLQKVRVERSCELLSGSDMRIFEIAQAVGYEDMKFFHQVFRRYVKMPPGEYRKKRGVY